MSSPAAESDMLLLAEENAQRGESAGVDSEDAAADVEEEEVEEVLEDAMHEQAMEHDDEEYGAEELLEEDV